MAENWNHCPWCGHRTYQHDETHCTHAVQKLIPCDDPQCGDSTWDHDCTERLDTIRCDCTHQFSEMYQYV